MSGQRWLLRTLGLTAILASFLLAAAARPDAILPLMVAGQIAGVALVVALEGR